MTLKPDAELNSQPDNGMISVSTYKSRCEPAAAMRCHLGMCGGDAGARCVKRQSTRNTTSRKIVTPIHL